MAFLDKLFQNSEQNQSQPIIDFESLHKAYEYALQEEDSQIAIKVDGIKSMSICFLEIPGSFDNDENNDEMKACKIDSSFALFNTFLF